MAQTQAFRSSIDIADRPYPESLCTSAPRVHIVDHRASRHLHHGEEHHEEAEVRAGRTARLHGARGCDACESRSGEARQEGGVAFKVAWIYPGPHNDGGWSQAHDAGRLAVEKALGSKVQTTYKENVFSNASVPQIVAGLVRDGYKMIFGTSFGMFELGVNGQLAAKYPNVLFEQATGSQVKKNQAEYFGAAEDTIYLSGMAAGAATKKGTIGYVVRVRHPRGRPSHQRFRTRRAGHASRREGEDRLDELVVLAAEGDGGGQGTRRRGRRRARSERRQPRHRHLRREAGGPVGRLRLGREEVRTEAVADRVGLRLGPVLRAPRPGRDERHLEAGFYYGSIKDGFTKLAPYGPSVSAKTKAAIAAKQKAIVAGTFNEFCGPVKDQSGKVRIPKGKCATNQRTSTRCNGSCRASSGPSPTFLRPASPLGQGPGTAARARGAGDSGASPAVSMRGITKRFPGVLANDGVDFEAARRRGTRAPRRERRRKEHAVEHPHRPLPAGRGGDQPLR